MDDSLKTYFALREEVPDAVRAQLRTKLQQRTSANHATTHFKETIPMEVFAFAIAPVFTLLSIMLIILVWAVFGTGAFLLSGILYMFSMISGAIVVLVMLKLQQGGVKHDI